MTPALKTNWDAIIAGGGLIGLSVAYGLVRHGLSVLVLDEGDVAFRASRGNFGLVWVQGKGAFFSPYAYWTKRSSDLWPKLAGELEELGCGSIYLEQNGGLSICLSDQEMEVRHDKLKHLQEHQNGQFQFKMLDRNELQDLVPGIGSKVVGAAYCPHDGHVNPLNLMRALVYGLTFRGGKFSANSALIGVEKCSANLRITTTNGQYECQRLVIAAGLANRDLAKFIGLSQSVRPQKGQIIITEKTDKKLPLPSLLLRQTSEGGMMIGDSHEDENLGIETCPNIISGIADRALATLPSLPNVGIVRSWAALRVITEDGYPIYDQSESVPGAFAFSCHSGVTLSAAHAFDLADYVVKAQLGPELASFSEKRFNV